MADAQDLKSWDSKMSCGFKSHHRHHQKQDGGLYGKPRINANGREGGSTHEGLQMRIVSVNVGLPREIQWRRETVKTSIFKAPVSGRVTVRLLNLEGDQQSDLTVHGGVDKAVYAYPSEHYAFWREELPGGALPWGAFGENLTTEGLLEGTVHIGDRLRIGSADFTVSQPRVPCYKLGVRFDRPDMVKRFLLSGRPGFYLRVSREGEVGAGDAVTLTAHDAAAVSVADIFDLYTADAADQDLLRRASELPALPDGWREDFRQRLSEPDA
jgi:MOSC domain-containing protein YiiM